MLYFSLPNFFENSLLNNYLQFLSKTKQEWFKTEIIIYNNSGSLPYLSWNGGINSNVGPGLYHDEMINSNRVAVLPICINCANVLLEDYDFYDCQGQMVLELFNNGSNILEISSIPFKEKIQSLYPNYRYKFSKNADLITEFTPEILNIIADQDDFLYVGIPDKYTHDLDWLKKLSCKKKCEITINPICNKNCKSKDTCLLQEHQNQIDYSSRQFLNSCNKNCDIFDINSIITIEQLLEQYKPLGFTHFTFSASYSKSQEEWLTFYLQYFLKSEFYLPALQMWSEYKLK